MSKTNKNQRWTKKRHYIITRILLPFFLLFFKLKYKLKIEKEKLPKEGSIILCNHTMTLDPALIGLKFNKTCIIWQVKIYFKRDLLVKH